jgi:hypothetical protein
VFPCGPLPLSLADLRAHFQPRAAPGCGGGGGGGGAPAVFRGPSAEPRPGDYVAVWVREVVGGATLSAAPLARTSAAEFFAAFAGGAPGVLRAGHPAAGWVADAAAAAAAAAPGGDVPAAAAAAAAAAALGAPREGAAGVAAFA